MPSEDDESLLASNNFDEIASESDDALKGQKIGKTRLKWSYKEQELYLDLVKIHGQNYHKI